VIAVCGIGGILHGDAAQEAEAAPLEAMNAAFAHRGPDDSGLWRFGPAGLAHRRLSILDPSPAGHQPMLSEDGKYVVVYNGEIYNFQELRMELEQHGCSFRTQCDTEVLLAACRFWGDQALERFNGIFAFALYDIERKRLLLARDRLGVKPLYYTRRHGTLAFASELDALARAGFVESRVNPAALDAYFTWLYIPAPDTIYAQVHKLRPGEKLVFQNGQMFRERYWRVHYAVDSKWTLGSAAEAYRSLLSDAIRLQRISDVPVGAFLSGGVDSSAVVGVLSRLCEFPVKTFSIGFEDAHANELDYARMAARHFHTEHTEAMLHPDMVETVPSLVRHFGEPFADSSALPMWFVSQVARRAVTVALSGDGGDELFAGYTWTHMNRAVARYRRVPAPLRQLIHTALRLLPPTPRTGKLRRFSEDSFLSPQESFLRRLSCFGPEARAALYTPELGEALAESAVDRFQEHRDEAEDLSDDDWMLYQDTVMYLPDDILTKVDRMSMAHGLEARVPLLDHRLVEFAATVPFGLKYDGRTSKRMVKHALRDLLPAPLLRQRKQGFSIPIQGWFREDLRGHFEEAVLGPDARCSRYLRQEAIRTLFRQHGSGREHYGHHLWALLVFEHWLRQAERP